MSKATAIAPSNVALVKYMGRKDEVLRLPENGSISMNLSDLLTTTTVEFDPWLKADIVEIDGEVEEGEHSHAVKHLDRIRQLAGTKMHACMKSMNNFPSGTGLSSSSSGFAALTTAATAAAGLRLSPKELSILARQGSGSSCRSIPDGFVEWKDGDTSETSYAESIFSPEYWDIRDVVAVVNKGRKEVKSSESHVRVTKGPYYATRIGRMPEKIKRCRKILVAKDFPALGAFLEEEALDLHAIFLTAGIIHLEPATILLMKLCPKWRAEGLQVYFTLNTGQDVHLFCEPGTVHALQAKLKELPEVREVIVNRPAPGARLSEKHLF